MKDSRPLAIAIIVGASVLVVGTAWITNSYNRSNGVMPGPNEGSGTRDGSATREGSGSRDSSDSAQGSSTRAAPMPTDIELLPESDESTVTGAVINGSRHFFDQEGKPRNVMIWDIEANHLLTVLPNSQYEELEKLIPDT